MVKIHVILTSIFAEIICINTNSNPKYIACPANLVK